MGTKTKEALYFGAAFLLLSTASILIGRYMDKKQIVEFARKFIGLPYVWGAQCPTIGADCSGLVYMVYKKFYPDFRDRTAQAYFNASLLKDRPEVGDLIFFGTGPNDIKHVGIVSGKNTMIHSGQSTGVTETNFNTPYWQNIFVSYGKITG